MVEGVECVADTTRGAPTPKMAARMSKIVLDDMLPPLLLDPSGMTSFLLWIPRTQYELIAGQWSLLDRAESHVDHASKGSRSVH